MALTRDEVVATAVRLLDEVGLEGLTLRRLAAELGVSAPTLYWHVKDKRTLLDLMSDALVASQRPALEPAPGQPWDEWLEGVAWAQYRALVSHRDAGLVVAGNRPTEDALPAVEQLLASLVRMGLPPADALDTLLTIGHFVIGSVVEHQAEAARTDDAELVADHVHRMRSATHLPTMHAAWESRRGASPDDTFAFGLDLLLTGLRARLDG